MAGPTQNSNKMTSAQAATALQRMQGMEDTLKKMHALLKQMHARSGSSASKDPVAKANFEMWELMLGHLDKQFEQLRLATLESEDLNTRRAALYKQAAAKAALAAEAARKTSAGSAMGTGTADQGTATVSTGPVAPGAEAVHNETETTPAPASSTPK